jgi:hypothetical protein
VKVNGKKEKGRSAVFILGGGSPKNFLLQTEPQIQEVLGIDERGHDYFLQVTDARPDTGGLSGATPVKQCRGARSIPIDFLMQLLLRRLYSSASAHYGLCSYASRATRAETSL